jgi:serine protease Do
MPQSAVPIRAPILTMIRAARRSAIRILVLAAVSVAVLASGCSKTDIHITESMDRMKVEAATNRVWPALVRIHVVNAYYRDGRERKSEASGSGFVISKDGYVVTNHHVAGDAVRLVCTMADFEEVPARLIGTDAMSDIAVLKLEPKKPREFPWVEWGESSGLRVGDPVLAMGSPMALSQSVTQGIVSNTALTLPRWDGEFVLDGENVGSIVRWIAHDAPIYPGNSGGPLVDLAGKVVGVNEIDIGLGGAIPADLARDVARQLIDQGDVKRAFLGFIMQPLFKSDPAESGVIVSDVIKGSPSDRAGLKSGDRLLRVEPAQGDPIDVAVRFLEQLPPLNLTLSRIPTDKPVKLTVERDGKRQIFETTPDLRERVLRDQKEFKQWGMTGRNLSFWTALEKKRESTDGLLVTSVRTGGPIGKAKPAINPGDILLRVGDKPVKDMDALLKITEDLTRDAQDDVPVVVAFAREGEELLTQVKIGLEELNDPGQDVRKPWIPVATQVLTRDLAEGLGMEGRRGVRVTQLFDDEGSTSTLGLHVGDILTEFDGVPIEAGELHDIEVFSTMVRQYRIGSDVTLKAVRDGKPIELAGRLGGRPPQAREMKRYLDHDFNFTVRDTAYLDAVEKQWKDRPTGAYVESVERGGWTALAGLQPSDLITAIDGRPIASAQDVREAMEAIKKAHPEAVNFQVRRDIHYKFLEIETRWE